MRWDLRGINMLNIANSVEKVQPYLYFSYYPTILSAGYCQTVLDCGYFLSFKLKCIEPITKKCKINNNVLGIKRLSKAVAVAFLDLKIIQKKKMCGGGGEMMNTCWYLGFLTLYSQVNCFIWDSILIIFVYIYPKYDASANVQAILRQFH